MHDLSNLHPLEAQGIRRDGQARPVPLRAGTALDVPATAAHLPEAQPGCTGCAGCPREVAGEVIESTREWWEIGVRV